MKKIMAVFAHPDDEGIVARTLAHYAQNNNQVMLVCATRGEAGEISQAARDNQATVENLGEVRQKELEEACRLLGIQGLEFLDYRDSGMDGTAENEDPRALIQAGPEEFTAKLVGLIRRFQPDTVITFEPFGWYGHPDHIYTGKWTRGLL
jgi:LmbE family N-acetylglucosaminyl deacetylase